MDILDNLVLPQSGHHIVLLKFLLGLTFLLLLPYLSVLLGATFYSVLFNIRAKRSGDKYYLTFSKSLIDIITFNKSITFALGIIPLLSAIFCYAQLLHGTGANVSEYLIISLVLFTISFIFIYTYKYSFHLKNIFSLVNTDTNETDENFKQEVLEYRDKANKLYSKSGLIGLVLIIISAYLFSGAVALAINSESWGRSDSVIEILFSINTLFYFLHFITASLAVISGVVLYHYFRPNINNPEKDEEYLSFVKKFALTNGLVFTILLLIIVLLNTLLTSTTALSMGMFGAIVIVLVLLFILSNLFYSMLKESNVRFNLSVIYIFILLFIFIVIKDQLAFNTTSQKQYLKLASEYEVYETELKTSLGLISEVVSAEDIFNGRCIACHQFDKKIVGPPYNDVLPKYVDDQDALIKFVLNPVKVDPNYPSMPNQGLKPNEAKAIADYLIKTYQEK
jgi:cytochrome c